MAATQAEIYKYLVMECNLSYEQIANLNSQQIRDLMTPDRNMGM